jgi:SulP family sulfate permease
VIVALVGLTEALSIARAIARRSEQRVDANQEFIGQGLANIMGAFFSSYAASGSLNRSGLNYEAGAKTPLAAMFSALFLVLVLMFVAPLAEHLPLASMGAILLLVGWALIDVAAIRKILRVSRTDTAVFLSTLLATLVVGLGFAIYFGVILSLILYVMRTARPRVIPADPEEYGHLFSATKPRELLAMRVRGSIYFGSTEYVRDALRDADADTQHDLLIDASHINFIDAAGAAMLAEEARRRRKLGHPLYFYRLNEEVRRVLARTGGLRAIGRENIFAARAPARRLELQEQPAG